MKYRRALFIVIYAKTEQGVRYSILKRKLHWKGWEFPKGGRRFYETERMAIGREIKEETGLKILEIKKFNKQGKYEYDKKYSDKKGFVGQSYKLYAVEVKMSKIRLSKEEHSDYKWVSFSDALKKLKWSNQKMCLKIVNSWLTNNLKN